MLLPMLFSRDRRLSPAPTLNAPKRSFACTWIAGHRPAAGDFHVRQLHHRSQTANGRRDLPGRNHRSRRPRFQILRGISHLRAAEGQRFNSPKTAEQAALRRLASLASRRLAAAEASVASGKMP
jgi:hypothetical protein